MPRSRRRSTQPIRTTPSDLQGERVAQERQQQAGGRLPQVQPPPSLRGALNPSQLPPLNSPSSRPDEPITAGLNLGAGPGPEALGILPTDEDVNVQILRQVLARHPSDALRRIVERAAAQNQPTQPLI